MTSTSLGLLVFYLVVLPDAALLKPAIVQSFTKLK